MMVTATAVCAFCGLLCDDVEVRNDAGALRPVRGACERSRAAFASLGRPSMASALPRVGGRETTLTEALEAAARLLRASRRPMISGLDVDVEGMRSVTALARHTGAVVDHAGSPAKYRILHVLQEAGWITTTLSEVRNRADVVVLLGEGWHGRMPRFAERVLAPPPMFGGDAGGRRYVVLNAVSDAARAALPGGAGCLALDAPLEVLPELLSMLAAMLAGQPADPSRIGGAAATDLAECARWLAAARYGVVVWSAADLEFGHAELALHALGRLLRVLNRKVRFAGLPLAGTDGDLTANAVQTWQSGLPLPASYAGGRVDFDPLRYSLPRILGREEHDLLVWVSSLGSHDVPMGAGVPAIVLGRPDRRFATEPAVFIPVATPGVDAAGHLLRTDKVVTMHLKPLRAGCLPAVSDVVSRLLARLGGAPC